MALLNSAINLTVVGMGVVFLSLIGLMYLIRILDHLFSDDKDHNDALVDSGPAPEIDELPLVLAAAAGHFLETERPKVIISKVRRNSNSGWALRVRAGRTYPRRPR